MSFTTRCPACGTMFKVVPDQLKISDGWVRCGHCSDVFDAMLNLQSEAPVPAVGAPPPPQPSDAASAPGSSRVVIRRVPAPVPDAPRPAAVQTPPPAPVFPVSASDPGWGFVSQFEDHDSTSPVSGLDASEEDAWDGDWLLSPQSVSAHRDAVTKELEQQPSLAGGAASRSAAEAFERELELFAAMGSPKDAVGITDPQAPETAQPIAPFAEDSGFGVDSSEPGFVVQGRRDAFWRKPAVRGVLWLLVVALSGGLLLQWAVQERDQLAARHPAVAPWLESYCALAGCGLAAPQRIEAVAIDSSTLVRKLGQLYSFDLVVKNSAAMPVAMPALELSLTDGRDKEIARRVFLPQEMPGTPTVVPARGSLSVSMRLSLSENELVGMAGYRALVFYP